MIIQFSLANYRSFHKIQTLNFKATGLVSEDKLVDQNNIAELDEYRLLKTIGVYGPNASGKSNLIKGLDFFRAMVAMSIEREELSRSEVNPFKLSIEKQDNSGFFQIVLLLNNKRYRYGFSLTAKGSILDEWLYGPAEKKETYYFKRHGSSIESNPTYFKEGLDIPTDKLRTDALFLGFCSSYDGEISREIRRYISGQITVDTDWMRPRFFGRRRMNLYTNRLVEEGGKDVVLRWMKDIGLTFSDVKLEKVEHASSLVETYVVLLKNVYNLAGEISGSVPMNLDSDESDGTRKFYSYIGRLHHKFEYGGLYICDEIDSNFHPTLLQRLIRLFNNRNVNKANAQLLFTSHDTNLMSPDIMRRDQFYFTEKSLLDETILFSLSDLKGIRNNADFARQYLAGFYGALPILSNYIEESTKN